MLLRLLPNALTILRLGSSPIVAWLLLESRFREALALVLFAGLTDWFDGYLARKLGAGGNFGAVLDPLADKILLITLFVVLGVLHLIPFWLLTLAVGRDLVIVAGALLLRLFRNRQRFVPSQLGKISTFFQIVFVLLVLVAASFPNPPFWWLRNIALVLTSAFTAWSGLDYVRQGIQMARRD